MIGCLRNHKDDVSFLTFILATSTFASWFLYQDFQRRGKGGGELIGKITFKNRVTQRKFASQSAWEDVENSAPLYSQDWIRTADASEAEIELKDGTKISLDQNTMIVLNLSAKGTKINFMHGSVAAKGAGQGLEISAQDKIIKIGDGDVKLSGTDSKEVALIVKKGEASINSGGKESRVGENEKATVGKDVSVNKVNLVPLSPGEGSRFFAKDTLQGVEFQWIKTANVVLEVSPDRSFARPQARIPSTGDRAVVNLPEGIYYWRLTSAGEASDVRRLSIIRRPSIALVSPAEGARFDYTASEPYVNFSFQKDEFAQEYQIEVFSDPGMQNRVFETRTQIASVSTKLPQGSYTWRVTSKGALAGADNVSAAQRFSIARREKAAAPVPLRPENNSPMSAVLIEKEGLVFSWSAGSELRKFRFLLSSNASFESPVTDTQVDNNFVQIKRDLPIGRYYWRVQGLDSAGNPSEFSGTQSLVVAKDLELKLAAPGDGTIIDYPGDSVTFRWDGPDMMRYSLLVAASKNFDSPIYSESVASRTYSIRNLKPGTYYWRVRIAGEKGTLGESEIRSFLIQDRLGDPAVVFPGQNTTVDMSARTDLPFRWGRSEGATGYVIKVYQIVFTRPKLIAQATVERPDYLITDLTLLDTGGFAYSIQPFRDIGNGRQMGREITVYFNIGLSKQPEKPQVVSPGVQFVE